MKLKVIKQKEFTVNSEKHIHYSAAFQGRVFGVNTMRIPAEFIKVDNNVLEITEPVSVLVRDSVNDAGIAVKYLDLVLKCELTEARF